MQRGKPRPNADTEHLPRPGGQGRPLLDEEAHHRQVASKCRACQATYASLPSHCILERGESKVVQELLQAALPHGCTDEVLVAGAEDPVNVEVSYIPGFSEFGVQGQPAYFTHLSPIRLNGELAFVGNGMPPILTRGKLNTVFPGDQDDRGQLDPVRDRILLHFGVHTGKAPDPGLRTTPTPPEVGAEIEHLSRVLVLYWRRQLYEELRDADEEWDGSQTGLEVAFQGTVLDPAEILKHRLGKGPPVKPNVARSQQLNILRR
mmetsp:Transcript_63669/g.149536  ORF Transcript_63669/g.149536 Transcript_63669/m.149536 type:complete len:262 (+) Transcript_63669:1084-1869(+)